MPSHQYWKDWFDDLQERTGFRLMPRALAVIINIAEEIDPPHEDFELLYNMHTIGGDLDGELYTIENDEYQQWWLVSR